jgi:hypothetical protein
VLLRPQAQQQIHAIIGEALAPVKAAIVAVFSAFG